MFKFRQDTRRRIFLPGCLQFQLEQVDPQPEGAHRVAQFMRGVSDQLPLGFQAAC